MNSPGLNSLNTFVQDIHISYNLDGPEHAETILFIHGFPLNKSMWNSQIEAFKNEFRLFALDLRGHGSSEVGEKEFSIRLFADDLIGFMDALQIDKAILCCLSMGGYIALNAALRFPDRFSALILADTSCRADTPEATEKRMHAIESIKNEGINQYAEESLKKLFAPDSLISRQEEVDAVRKMILTTGEASIFSSLYALAGREESCSGLHLLQMPVLIITGEKDVITPPETAEYMHQNIRGSRLHILEGAGHMSNMENPGGFNEQLLMFLSSR